MCAGDEINGTEIMAMVDREGILSCRALWIEGMIFIAFLSLIGKKNEKKYKKNLNFQINVVLLKQFHIKWIGYVYG